MFNHTEIITNMLAGFFTNIFDRIVNGLSEFLANIFSHSQKVLEYEFVVNTVKYAQILALVLLGIKVMYEVFQTYIMYQSGDPDADPSGLLMKTLQATAIIAFTPKLVEITFTFGTKLTNDITGISGGTVTNPWTTLLVFITGVDCIITVIIAVLTLIAVLIIGLQTLIRGAELALLSVLGPVLALNLTSDNRGTWNVWVKHLIVLCCSQAMQIFMYKGAMVLLTYELSLTNMFFLLGWMWVTVMTPRFMKQFIYSSGIGSAGMSVGRTLLLRRALK